MKNARTKQKAPLKKTNGCAAQSMQINCTLEDIYLVTPKSCNVVADFIAWPPINVPPALFSDIGELKGGLL